MVQHIYAADCKVNFKEVFVQAKSANT